MKKTFVATITAMGILAADFSLAADRPDFDYISAQYLRQKLDFGNLECTQDGFGLGGSMALDEQLYILAGASDVSGDDCGSQMIRAGAGIRSDYGTMSVLYLNASLFNMDIDNDDSGLGYGIAGGIRTLMNPSLEAYGQLAYDNVDIDGTDLGLTLSAGIVYSLVDDFALAAELALGSENDATGINVGIRYYF